MNTNRQLQFKTPFINKIFDEKYSPNKGFGKKTSVERDKHTIEINKSIDNAIENVAS